jgi:hypothetical protein
VIGGGDGRACTTFVRWLCNGGLTQGNIIVYTALTWRRKKGLRYDETFLLLVLRGKSRVTLVGYW